MKILALILIAFLLYFLYKAGSHNNNNNDIFEDEYSEKNTKDS